MTKSKKHNRSDSQPFFIEVIRYTVKVLPDKKSADYAPAFNAAKGILKEIIFQMPAIHSGLASVKANLLLASNQTKDHYYPRTNSAKALIRMLQKDPDMSDDKLIKWLLKRCQVHSVTKEENMVLKKYTTKNPNSSWKKAYAACGIRLEPKTDKRRKHYDQV